MRNTVKLAFSIFLVSQHDRLRSATGQNRKRVSNANTEIIAQVESFLRIFILIPGVQSAPITFLLFFLRKNK